MPNFNERTISPTKANRINSLFEQLEQDRRDYVDAYRLKQIVMNASAADSSESEQTQFEGSSEESQNAGYSARKSDMQNVGSHRRSPVPNVRELNSTPLSDLNSERSKTQSALEPARYSR